MGNKEKPITNNRGAQACSKELHSYACLKLSELGHMSCSFHLKIKTNKQIPIKHKRKTLSQSAAILQGWIQGYIPGLMSLLPADFLLVPLVSAIGCRKQGVPLLHSIKISLLS